jgi:hypothetical protein
MALLVYRRNASAAQEMEDKKKRGFEDPDPPEPPGDNILFRVFRPGS